ncbi:MAG: hypothetical protein M1823_000836 [Watsoniomyces obsoletus]|nr:MAG: hypothetical protein M1823_000836 [Watsoniomyces obsoletus]
MPAFKGLAVSIHTSDGPLLEYSIQRQGRHGRITSYIPVPPPKVPSNSTSNRPEQPNFAISVTLLTPGMRVPYSKPRPSSRDGSPQPQLVGMLPEFGGERGRWETGVRPYSPLTASVHETVAAYIYFDGRSKEEVATLLRRGEETWVNSRWVSVPASEGGGLAEREFLFREVGLERWLNGLDLEGKDVDARVKRRRERMERRRRRRRGTVDGMGSPDLEMNPTGEGSSKKDVRNGAGDASNDMLDDSLDMSTSDSDSEPPSPEAAGQIKVALFRVIASGEIKRGEYSPQFDAHDDDEDAEPGSSTKKDKKNGLMVSPAEIDHTTSFAKPKTLDPESISTQTVTGIDPPEKPYAVFTFLYRSERQLQKMGILPGPKPEGKTAATPTKRRSLLTDIAKLPPLKSGNPVNFSGFRDPSSASPAGITSGPSKAPAPTRRAIDDDSDDEEQDNHRSILTRDMDDDVDTNGDVMAMSLAAAENDQRGELAEAVRKIKLKRAHSNDQLEHTPRKSGSSTSPPTGLTPQISSDGTTKGTPTVQSGLGIGMNNSNNNTPSNHPVSTTLGGANATTPVSATDENQQHMTSTTTTTKEDGIIGSPMKKSRPSLAGAEDDAVRKRLGLGLFGSTTGEALTGGVTFGNNNKNNNNSFLSTSSGGGGNGNMLSTAAGLGDHHHFLPSQAFKPVPAGHGHGKIVAHDWSQGGEEQGIEDVMIADADVGADGAADEEEKLKQQQQLERKEDNTGNGSGSGNGIGMGTGMGIMMTTPTTTSSS